VHAAATAQAPQSGSRVTSAAIVGQPTPWVDIRCPAADCRRLGASTVMSRDGRWRWRPLPAPPAMSLAAGCMQANVTCPSNNCAGRARRRCRIESCKSQSYLQKLANLTSMGMSYGMELLVVIGLEVKLYDSEHPNSRSLKH
jgi:hypothetical protein